MATRTSARKSTPGTATARGKAGTGKADGIGKDGTDLPHSPTCDVPTCATGTPLLDDRPGTKNAPFVGAFRRCCRAKNYYLQVDGRYFAGIAVPVVDAPHLQFRTPPLAGDGVIMIPAPLAAVFPIFVVAEIPTSAVPFHDTEETYCELCESTDTEAVVGSRP